jgi:hypothetical protein
MKLAQKLLESSSKWDDLITIVDSDEHAAQLLDDVTYLIAGILNGGLEMVAESDTYYQHYTDARMFLRQYPEGVIGKFYSLLRKVSEPVREHRLALKRRRDDYDHVENSAFPAAADELENWLYNPDNLNALSEALLGLTNQ